MPTATTAPTTAIEVAYADRVAAIIEANAPYGVKVAHIDYRWSECETLVDGEWHPIPLVDMTWDNGNTVSADDHAATVAAIRLARAAS